MNEFCDLKSKQVLVRYRKTYFSKSIASWSVEGNSTFPVSGSNKQSKPTDIFTIAKIMYGTTGFTFLP